MILLSKELKSGKRKICDHKCYRSSGYKCKCICGGLNHGRGLQAAIESTTLHRKYFKSVGVIVKVEDRLLFDTDPKRMRFKK